MSERPQDPPPLGVPSPVGAREQILDVAAVMLLLGLNDARTARRTMRQAGAFRVGRSYRVRATRLASWIAKQEMAESETPVSPQRRGGSPDAWVGEIERLAR
jgi:hypothetical protein